MGEKRNLKFGVACDRHRREKKFEDWCGVRQAWERKEI
jgi:hypothetical protein